MYSAAGGAKHQSRSNVSEIPAIILTPHFTQISCSHSVSLMVLFPPAKCYYSLVPADGPYNLRT